MAIATEPQLAASANLQDSAAVGWHPLTQWRTWLVVLIWVSLTDFAIYRGGGMNGWSLASLAVPIAILMGPRRREVQWPSLLTVVILSLALALKLLWCGSAAAVLAILAMIFAAIATSHGELPTLLRCLTLPFGMVVGPIEAMVQTVQHHRLHSTASANHLGLGPVPRRFQWTQWFGVGLPLMVVIAFVGIFILANPNLQTIFERWNSWVSEHLTRWFEGIEINVVECIFWLFSAAFIIAAMFPFLPCLSLAPLTLSAAQQQSRRGIAAALYPAARNTLIAVVPLFAAYLIFEFISLGRREFEPGFYYAGYAHEGAFWLTVALGLATATLSAIFSNWMNLDPRTVRLRPLAFAWVAENLLLALAVYNRLAIYIDFNGMTRMRVIGILGVTAVVAGTLLVIVKILRGHSLLWLVQRQLLALALAVIGYAALPVDWIVHGYNARQVLLGDLAPSVQMIAHETRADGMLQIMKLVDCEDEQIREGVRALLARWRADLQEKAANATHWTQYQIADDRLLTEIDLLSDKLTEYEQADRRDQRIAKFYNYAYQWY